MQPRSPSIVPCDASSPWAPLAQTLAQDAASFAARGWMLGTSGSVSARLGADPLAMLITVSGKDKGNLGPADFLRVEDDGLVLETLGDPKASSESLFAGLPKPSGETLVHAAIYARFADAGAVYHVHSVSGTLCSQLARPGEPLRFRDLEMLKGIGRWEFGQDTLIPVVWNDPDIPGLSRLVGEAARAEVPGVVVQGHGIYVWGPDPARARRHTEIFEFLFEYEIRRRMAGI
jgi:methylthioribulose-1-phosphate dehydratase